MSGQVKAIVLILLALGVVFLTGFGPFGRGDNHRAVVITGNKRLPDEVVYSLLPHHQTNRWWREHSDEIIAHLVGRLPVLNIKIDMCSADATCFVVRIKEDVPLAIYRQPGSQQKLLFSQGRFFPASEQYFERPAIEVIESVSDLSPDISRARIIGAADLVQLVISQGGVKNIATVGLQESGEMNLDFNVPRFSAIFSATSPHNVMRREVTRLNKIIQSLGPKLESVEQIDLAFSNQAVIRRRGMLGR